MDIITLALAKKYANKVAAGFSSVSVEDNKIIFTLNDGKTAEMTVPTPADGKDGISITNVEIDDENNLLCTLSNGETINAGKLPIGSSDNGSLEQIQSDYNQNDETANDYIKNRPFYEAIVDYSILENAERTTSMINYDWGQGFNIEQEHADLIQSLANVPKNYRLTLDGEVNEGTFEGTLLRVSSEKHGNIEITPYWLWFENYYNDPVTLTIEFVISAVSVKKIDDKFLSDNVFIQSDWNQNDETALDYVKNRVCYETYEATKVFNQPYMSLTPLEGYTGTYRYEWDPGEINAFHSSFIEGKESELANIRQRTFEAIFDGKRYSANASYYEADKEINFSFYFDDGSVLIRSFVSTENTQPFVEVTYHNVDKAKDEVSLKLNELTPSIVKLDEKYLPDTIATKEDIVQSDWNQNDSAKPDYIKNRICYEESTITEDTILTEAERNLKWNGGDVGDWSYVFTDDEYSTLMSVLEGKTEVNFAMTIDDSEYISSYYKDEKGSWKTSTQWVLDGTIAMSLGLYINTNRAYIEGVPMACKISSGIHTVSLKSTSENIEIVTIPEKFLPESVLTQPDWNQNDETAPDYIKNRPFYETTATKALIENKTITLTKGTSDTQYTYTFDENDVITISGRTTSELTWNGKKYTTTSEYNIDTDYWFYRVTVDEGKVYIYEDHIKVSYNDVSSVLEEVTIWFTSEIPTVCAMAGKFLPNNIATTQYVDEAISTAIGTVLEGSY